MSSNDRLKCSFCGKTQDQVKKLIAGPDVFICDECVELCNEILDEELELELDDISNDEEEKEALEPILTAREKNTVSTLDATEAEKTKEQEELDESVSLFGNIKRNYAQGISPIFNK